MPENKNNLATVLDFEIPSFYKTMYIDIYGGVKISIYSNKLLTNFFYTPLLIVNWADFKENLEILKTNFNSEDFIETSILINHLDVKFEDKVLAKILSDLNSKKTDNISISDISLNIVPFKFFKIYAKIGDNKICINEDDFTGYTPDDNYSTQLTLLQNRVYQLKGKLKDIVYFFDYRKVTFLWGNLYSDGTPYSTTTISAISTFFNNSKNINKLFGDEDLNEQVIVNSHSSGGGFGLSLGPMKIGYGEANSSVESRKNKKRILNRNFFSNVLYESKSDINIVVDGDIEKHSALITELTSKLFENKTKFQAKIDATDLNNIKIIGANLMEYSMKDNSEKLLKSKPKIIIEPDGTKTFETEDGKKGTLTDKLKVETSDEIEWEEKGGEFIPVKIDLYSLTESELKDEYSSLAVLFSREAKKNTITPFLYPAHWLSYNEYYLVKQFTDKDNPIGSILAFAGQEKDKPEGWLICDGSILKRDLYPDLFNVIRYHWGKGNDETEFKIPNLQGQFLRGVDYSKTIDPEADKRILNGEGLSCEVGSYQNDTFKEHEHQYIAKEFKFTNNDGNNRANSIDGNGRTVFTHLNDNNSETRPKNAYVNYIIRIK